VPLVVNDMAVSSRPADSHEAKPDQYVVVARRYRPQAFDELIGQEHVSRALSNAITTQRVGHAYLFTGARGVGKTSAARILAKALNCERGPTPTPCNQCDNCQRISGGDDVDVLEIDGASNRGIDEIRQLRQNVNVRPSRARFKIYIIDEVHMLTREAFNALLKTLEEPPEHVKFIFCTTEPAKIPITILSRCQRFDFAGILPSSIAGRLRQIVDAEGVQAECEALEVLARRANGSMRDSQSLLEQLLAFAPERITVADVHGMLGSAGDERLGRLVRCIVARDAAGALAEVDAAVAEGVDLSQLLEQIFGYLRDCMAAALGCTAESLLYAFPSSFPQVQEAGKSLGLETLLAAMQILDQTLARFRFSTQGRVLAELALVRICSLENLDELSALVAELRGSAGSAASPRSDSAGSKKKVESVASQANAATTPATPADNGVKIPFTSENALRLWNETIVRSGGLASEQAKQFERVSIVPPAKLEVCFRPGHTLAKALCERPEQVAKFEQALAEITGQTVRVGFTVADGQPSAVQAPVRVVSPHQRLLEAAQHPMIQRATELFGAQPLRVDEAPAAKKLESS
jgi:DNA polymerase-3 subunit gamma/tau